MLAFLLLWCAPNLSLTALLEVMLASRDCLEAGDSCSGDETCSPRLRTLRQCVAGNGSMKLGPGARSQCANAVSALLSSPLHGCQCKRGMKKEKNCLSIYWSLHQSIIHGQLWDQSSTLKTMCIGGLFTMGGVKNDCDVTGIKSMFLSKSVPLSGLNLVERYPYETVRRDYDYVRLASITAGKFNGLHYLSSRFHFSLWRCFVLAKKHNFTDFSLGRGPKQTEGPFQTQLHKYIIHRNTIPASKLTSSTKFLGDNCIPRCNVTHNVKCCLSFCLNTIFRNEWKSSNREIQTGMLSGNWFGLLHLHTWKELGQQLRIGRDLEWSKSYSQARMRQGSSLWDE